MATPYTRRPRPPGIYRAARALRRVGTIVVVLLVIFVAFVAYSAVQVVRSSPHLGTSSVAMEPNGTVGFTTSFSLVNTGYLPIQRFALDFLVQNQSGTRLVSTGDGPVTVVAGGTLALPIAIYFPLNSTAGESLLTENQYLDWHVWGNATYGYLFSVSLAVATERSWGAPFDDLTVTVGAPSMTDDQISVPVTVAFSNNANFDDQGAIDFQVNPPSGAPCGAGSFAVDVPAGENFNETQYVPIASGCDPAGGSVTSEYVQNGVAIPLPREAIP